MSPVTQKIQELLLDDSLKHSSAKEAMTNVLKEIEALTTNNVKLNDENKRVMARLNSCFLETEKLTKENELLKAAEKEVARREATVRASETRQLRDTMALEYEQLRVADGKETLTLLLRNRVVSNQVLSSVPVVLPATLPPTPDQYGNMQYGDASRVENVETATKTDTEDK